MHLTLRNLSKSFGSRKVIDSVSALTLTKNEKTCAPMIRP